MTRSMVTGAATADGRPIYMRRDHSWTDRLAEGATVEPGQGGQEELERMLTAARADEFTVCDPYVIKVDTSGDEPRPVSLREVIRASGGPTIAIAS